MAVMEYNKNPISLREGKIFIDGVECLDSIKCEIKFTPDVWTGRQLGEITQSSRWLGATISGTITRRRSTPWLREAIKKYMNDKGTPEFTIQGIMDDENSDYYAENGSETITCVGCVLTGDLNLINLDSGGEVVDDAISFNAKDIV
ncbi:MAG: phage tail tube protein [Oscillospiraceae bacterium]|nr:phage tail tube protein [Oscillospiraceae bacterium]